MSTILITAFKPYDNWIENSSWLALVELAKDFPPGVEVTTRLYPVDFAEMKERLTEDMQPNYDVSLHLGQAPGEPTIRLERVGINIGAERSGPALPLVDDGPEAYRSSLPLDAWAAKLIEQGIPAHVSHHAGTYLCNATLYWSHLLAERMSLQTKSAFLHLPLATPQVAASGEKLASLPVEVTARAVRLILEELA